MFVNNGTDMLYQLNNCVPETYSGINSSGLSGSDFLNGMAEEHGLKEIFSDTGLSLGLAGAATVGIGAATSAGTATGGSSILAAASATLSGVGSAMSGAITTLGGGAISSVALPAVVGAVAAAGGGIAGFQIGEQIVEDNFDEIDAIVKKFQVGGDKVACWIKDGKTYIASEVINGLMGLMVEKGYFSEAVDYSSGEIVDFSDFIVMSTQNLAVSKIREIANNISDTTAKTVAEMFANSLEGVDFSEIGNNISYFSFSLIEGAAVYTLSLDVYYVETNRAKGTITTYDDDYLSTTTQGQLFDLTLEEALPSKLFQVSQNFVKPSLSPSTWNIYRSESLPSTNFRAVSSQFFVTGNIGVLNDNALEKQSGATLPTSGDISVDYPSWADAGIRVGDHAGTGEDEGAIVGIPAIPLGLSIPGVQTDAQAGTLTNAVADTLADTMADVATDVLVPSVDPTPIIGTTPAVPVPTSGSDTGMVKIYNPTSAQLSAFSEWLWSANIFDNFSKLLQDPMQAILGLNILYATPSRGEVPTNIIVGNIDSNKPSRYVTNQYINIDCGSVTVNKYFNNVLDYINTEIQLYLPFIGIVNLSQKEIVGRSVSVKYKIDVMTGTCVAKVRVANQLLYTFTGCCAVQLPLTAANYTGVYSTIASIAASTIGGAIKGGIGGALVSGMGGALMGAASGGFSSPVERSGNIGSNAGAMLPKTPYLIITRNKPYNPTAYNKYYGYPSNTTVTLNQCSGFTRVKDIRLHDIYTYDGDAKVVATDGEMSLIESQLKGGIII